MSFVNWNAGPLNTANDAIEGSLNRVGHAIGVNPCRAIFVPVNAPEHADDAPALDHDHAPAEG